MWTKWLHHTCPFGGPQRSARGQKFQMAKWPTCVQSGDITPAVLGVINAQRGEEIRNGYVAHRGAKWLYHSCYLGDPKHSTQGPNPEMALWPTCGQRSPLPPWGFPMLSAGTKK